MVPDVGRVAQALDAAGARFVLIGGFAVVAHQVMRTTEDCGLLIPDSQTNDAALAAGLAELGVLGPDGAALDPSTITARENLRVESPTAGLIDLVRGGAAPLDFDSVAADSIEAELNGVRLRVAGLASLVALKRLAGRPRDLADLADLEARHGPLPELS